ncbi:hypothetical protein BRARA_G03118 [Brassica rapa]|uniref:Uncharacterized protein n=2 Tax=Brassica campestris TaxID=3711 RepID=A0A397YR50_BRACM|nr:hypothetical protein BRARA_G03118 [Brassica rapa]CAG7904435.1 unnamed protein product [Brassica rapa]VDD01932.1 unnamed protein product [Brassica rapa]
MKRLQTPVSTSATLILLLLVLYSSNVKGRQILPASMDVASSKAVRDLNINKEMKEESLRGEKDSFRRIPRSGASPIQNRKGPLTYARRSRNQQITATEP